MEHTNSGEQNSEHEQPDLLPSPLPDVAIPGKEDRNEAGGGPNGSDKKELSDWLITIA